MGRNKLCTMIVLFSLSARLYGELGEELNAFFDKCGSSANVSAPDVYSGQKAGYMTGGGMVVRNRVLNSNLATIDLPRFDAGCGGIDIYSGGFSFINQDRLIQTLKSIGSSSLGYAFLLGLETVSPQIANNIKLLQSWANKINSVGINSCELGSQLVGSVWPARTAASQQICRTLGGKGGLFSDYIAARHRCSEESEYRRATQPSSKDSSFQNLIVDEYNIAWQAIQKQSYLAQDREMAELVMTLMGTVIRWRDQHSQVHKTKAFAPSTENESFLRKLLEGGELEINGCARGDAKCLRVEKKRIFLSPEQAWGGRVRAVLMEMQRKILQDEELTVKERELLSKSRLPLYKIVNVLTAYKHGYCPVDLYQVADIVALELLVQFLKEVVSLVREGANQLRQAQMYAKEIDEYLMELGRVEQLVRYYEGRTNHQMAEELHLINKIQLLESQIAAEIML